MLCSSPDKAAALHPRGPINDDLSYSDLEIIYTSRKKGVPYTFPEEKKPRFVSGCINNKTDKAIRFKATLVFDDFFNRPTAKAKIKKKVPAYGKACFKTRIRLIKDPFSDFNLTWEIKSPLPKKQRVPSKPKKRKKPGESSIRELKNGFQITGRSSVTTKSFHLEKGSYSFQANVPEDRFSAYLITKGSRKKTEILSQTGAYARNDTIEIKKGGFHALKITTDGSWRVEIELAEVAGAEPKNSCIGSDVHHTIFLKNGKTITADLLTVNDSTVSIVSNGTALTINKNSILKTEMSKNTEEESAISGPETN